ncbi:MAG: replicative DNA helicase [Candidatus Margulisiibacteriota bacterium]
MNTKIQPQDLDAEQSVLGSMLISKEAIAIVIGKVKQEHFYRQANANIFQAMCQLYQKSEPVDLITVGAQLKKNNAFEESGGSVYLAQVIDSVPTASNAEHYAEIVVEKAMLRKLIHVGSDIVNDAFQDDQDVDDVLNIAQKNIMDISKERVSDDFVKLDSVLKQVFDDIQAAYDSEDKILGVPTGYIDLDTMTSGFQKADLVILAARPSMGKTTLALNFAVHAALKKFPVAIFSLETPKEQMALRMLSSEAKIDSKRMRTSNLHEHEYRGLMHAMGALSDSPIFIDDTPGITPMDLRAKTRRLQMEADIKLIVIDYLQLMRSSKKKVESRFQEVSDIVREVKAFAKESKIPIIALSQLSREVEKRGDKKPQLSDLRESGEIEQTADLVMFIHRDDYYGAGGEGQAPVVPGKAELIISKQRNGPTGKVDLVFKKDISKFLSAEKTAVSLPPSFQ